MNSKKENDILCYTGSKRKVVASIWERFGSVSIYIEPFCGSGVVYMCRPNETNTTLKRGILNDVDGLVCNYLRTIHYKKDELLDFLPKFKDRRAMLQCQELIDVDLVNTTLAYGPLSCDPEQAAYYFYAKNLGFFNTVTMKPENKNPYTKLIESDINNNTITEIHNTDWEVVLSKPYTRQYDTVKTKAAILLDPPYSKTEFYYKGAKGGIATDAYEWAVENASEKCRVAYCCYSDHFPCPSGWHEYSWSGMTITNPNAKSRKRKEAIYFSPHSEYPTD